MSTVLVVATHPDDETLGCGGTLLKHKARGDTLWWIIVTRAWEPKYSKEAVLRQAQQVKAVGAAYPFDHTEWCDFKTTSLDSSSRSAVIDRLREIIQRIRPDVVYAPNPLDAHSDHRLVFEALMAVLKSFYMPSLGVRRILACEVPSETDAGLSLGKGDCAPQVFSDISDTIERKLAIMKLFDSEVQPEPLPRSLSAIRALARSRGASAGVEYAEAFVIVRELV